MFYAQQFCCVCDGDSWKRDAFSLSQYADVIVLGGGWLGTCRAYYLIQVLRRHNIWYGPSEPCGGDDPELNASTMNANFMCNVE